MDLSEFNFVTFLAFFVTPTAANINYGDFADDSFVNFFAKNK